MGAVDHLLAHGAHAIYPIYPFLCACTIQMVSLRCTQALMQQKISTDTESSPTISVYKHSPSLNYTGMICI